MNQPNDYEDVKAWRAYADRLEAKLEAAERDLAHLLKVISVTEGIAKQAESQAAKLAEALEMLYIAAPEGLECQNFPHFKKEDRHKGFECGPLDRYNAAMNQASEALEAYKEEK